MTPLGVAKRGDVTNMGVLHHIKPAEHGHSVAIFGDITLPTISSNMWVCLKIGYIPNEIAIQKRDNDQQNHWV